jgi:hypothetical protein
VLCGKLIIPERLTLENGGLNGRYFNLFRKFESGPGE